MCLSEPDWPDRNELKDYCKVCMCKSVDVLLDGYSFLLLGHKADHFFEGNLITVGRNGAGDDPYNFFLHYLSL